MRILLFLLASCSAFGQYFDSVSVADKIAFVKLLHKNKQVDDARYLVHYINREQHSDSLTLMEIKFLLELRQEKNADSLLYKFSAGLKNPEEYKCTQTLIRNHIRLLNNRSDSLNEPGCNHQKHKEVWRVHLLSSLLMRKKLDEFEMIFNSEKNTDADLSLIEFDLYVQKEEIRRRPKKSRFLAGLMSAILPGTGKLYAGKPHEALNAFLPVVFNGAQAAEGYYYNQLESPHFYVFSAIGTVFYASNIYGSARAAKRKNDEFSDRIKANIDFEITKLIKYY